MLPLSFDHAERPSERPLYNVYQTPFRSSPLTSPSTIPYSNPPSPSPLNIRSNPSQLVKAKDWKVPGRRISLPNLLLPSPRSDLAKHRSCYKVLLLKRFIKGA